MRGALAATGCAALLVALALAVGGRAAREQTYAPAFPDAAGASASARSLAGASEGVASTNAPAWHAAGYTGQGVTVAVIDSGFKDRSAVANVTLVGQDCANV